MEKKQRNFETVLNQVVSRLKKSLQTALLLQEIAKAKRMEMAYTTAFDLAHEVERTDLLTRALPAYTGHPRARAMTEEMIGEIVPVNVGYTHEGWFGVFIPALLPKKNRGSTLYIYDIIYPALKRFFSEKVPVRYANCVLIFRHIYNRERPERRYRDHDNIELNTVADAVAFYSMKDDSALECFHYYCSAPGSEDRTEVYVVPQSEFCDWHSAEKLFPDEGVELLIKHPKTPE